MTLLTDVPPLHGSHCAGIGCEHDELAGSGLEPVAPHARTAARHRGASSGRRVRVVSLRSGALQAPDELRAINAQHVHDRDALLG